MAKYTRHQSDGERLGKCDICLNTIPIEYDFGEGDHITCYECGTEYRLVSKRPVKLAIINDYGEDDHYGELIFDH